jgi:hypothetical protein
MQVRDGQENVTGEKELYTGANTFEVVAIAPTVEEMSTVLGFKEPKAPTIPVGTDDAGNVRVRIDFWLKQPESNVTEKKSFFITKAKRVSSKGTTQYINSVAQTGWWTEGEAIPSNYTTWYNPEGVRPAYQGEEEFIQFMQAYLNHKGGKNAETFGLKDWNAIFNGDFSELKGYMKQANQGTPNRVGMLMGVRSVDGDNGTKYYQSFYRNLYTRSYQDLNKAFTAELGRDGAEFKDDYQGSLVWQKWTVGGTVSTGEAAGSTTTSTPAASVW